MTVSKSKRDANKKWDAANMTVVGCRVTKDKAAQFKAACAAAGTNPNAVLLACVNDFIAAGAVQAVPWGDSARAGAAGVSPETTEN